MARNDMFSWLLGQKQKAAAQSEAGAFATDVEDVAEEADVRPAAISERIETAAFSADEVEEEFTESPNDAIEDTVASAAALDNATATQFEHALSAPETVRDMSASARHGSGSATVTPDMSVDGAPTEVAVATLSASVQQPSHDQDPTISRVHDYPNRPEFGMSVYVRNGSRLESATIDSVAANGRKILIKVHGKALRRAYTLRDDGSYRLEGAPDGSEPVIEVDHTSTGTVASPDKTQRWKPLR